MIPSEEHLLVFDRDDALSRLADWECILAMLRVAAESPEFTIDPYRDALYECDYQRLAALTHTLIGVASNLSLKAIHEVAVKFNKAARTKDQIRAAAEFAGLKHEFERFYRWMTTTGSGSVSH